MMRLPLNLWRIYAKSLPERLMEKEEGFSLPGADTLSAFSDLIGENEEALSADQEQSAEYAPCGLFEEEITGAVTLKKEIDFGALTGDRAVLTFEHIEGKGEILLGGSVLARFDSSDPHDEALVHAFESTGVPCRLCVDVTKALLLGKRETLELRFDDARPAGVCGAVFVHTSFGAHLCRVSIQADARRSLVSVRARACAHQAGRYILRAQVIPGGPDESLPPARETDMVLDQGEEKMMQLSMELSCARFTPGKAYDPPAMRIQLYEEQSRGKSFALPCDETLLWFGCGSAESRAFLPIVREECTGDLRTLSSRIKELNVPAVWMDAPVSDGVYRALCREGISCVQHVGEALRPSFVRYPCLTLLDHPYPQEKLSPQAAAWQMSGSVAFPRTVDDSLTDEERLLEASGRKLDGTDEGVRASLAWLRAVQIRLRAEAARQSRYQGALCSAQESENEDILDAIRTAFAPVHLSALPLSGAWWTGTRFSASLEAFLSKHDGSSIRALAVLEDEEGKEFARFEAPCTRSGYAGVIEAQLPDYPCVLTLVCRLMQGEDVLEESSIPVYVGELGPLEAAF